jgi:hypothetical protein
MGPPPEVDSLVPSAEPLRVPRRAARRVAAGPWVSRRPRRPGGTVDGHRPRTGRRGGEAANHDIAWLLGPPAQARSGMTTRYYLSSTGRAGRKVFFDFAAPGGRAEWGERASFAGWAVNCSAQANLASRAAAGRSVLAANCAQGVQGSKFKVQCRFPTLNLEP